MAAKKKTRDELHLRAPDHAPDLMARIKKQARKRFRTAQAQATIYLESGVLSDEARK